MNRSRKKSPSRRGSASPSRRINKVRRNASKSPLRRSLRDRSRSRNRTTIQADRKSSPVREERKLRPRQKSPVPILQDLTTRTASLRSSVTRERRFESEILKSDRMLRKSPSIDRDEVIRNSISRFDGVVSEAVVTVRSRISQESDLKTEFNKEVKTLLHGNNVPIEEELPPKFFGGWLGALLLMFIIPSVAVLLQTACSKNACQIDKFEFSTSLKTYFDLEPALWYIGFLFWELLLTTLPVGSYVHGFPETDLPLNCRCNGLANLVLTVSCVLGIWYFGLLEVGLVLDRMVQMSVSSVVIALIASLALYFKPGAKTSVENHFGNTANFVYDFWTGRRINPRLGPVDLKLFCIRSSLVLAVIINVLFIIAECQGKNVNSQFSTPLLLISTLQIIYLSDFFIFEKDYLTSFTIQHEGFGYMLIMSSAVFPFFITFIPKCVLFNTPEDRYYILLAVTFVYFIGYALFRASNSQKASFRKDFRSSQFSSIDTLVCIDGRRLLIGGLWGWLRHPNHLGCLIIYWSWALAAFLTSDHQLLMPLAVPAIMTILLVHRCSRDLEHCRYRYGSSWGRYTSRVKYHMFPKVF